MNKNEENYKRSFNALHLSEDFPERLEARLNDEREDKKMNSNTLHGFSRIAAAIAACAVTLGVGGVCYAADLGGIRTKVELWMNGEKTEVELEQDGMGYSWTDEYGENHGFGGMVLEEGGKEIPMTAEELAGQMNNEAVLRDKDGRLNLYYKNLCVDVTDMIGSDGTLYIHINDPVNPYTYFNYSEIDPKGAYHCSSWDRPEAGAEYIEIDASELESDSPAPERGDDVTVGTYTMVDED